MYWLFHINRFHPLSKKKKKMKDTYWPQIRNFFIYCQNVRMELPCNAFWITIQIRYSCMFISILSMGKGPLFQFSFGFGSSSILLFSICQKPMWKMSHMDFKTYACLTHAKLPAREKSLYDIYCFQIGFYLCQLIQGLLLVAQPSTLVNYLGEVSKMHWFHFMCHTTIRRLLTQVSNLSCRCFSVHW